MLTKDGISFSKIILAVGRSDLRKGIDGLATIVRLKYGLDPLEKDTLSGLPMAVSNGPGLLMKPAGFPAMSS